MAVTKGKTKMTRKKSIPLISKEQYSETRKKQGTQNKDRSKAMENAIAKYLRGRRVPMSGAAAAYKGDVEIEFENVPGKYLIECKLSAGTTSDNDKTIRIDYRWFEKHQLDTVAMRAKFGVFILHYLGQDYSRDFVLIRMQDVTDLIIIKYQTPYADTLYGLIESTVTLDLRYQKNGTQRTGYNLKRSEIEERLLANKVGTLQAVKVIIPFGEYLLLTLKDFRDVLAHM